MVSLNTDSNKNNIWSGIILFSSDCLWEFYQGIVILLGQHLILIKVSQVRSFFVFLFVFFIFLYGLLLIYDLFLLKLFLILVFHQILEFLLTVIHGLHDLLGTSHA